MTNNVPKQKDKKVDPWVSFANWQSMRWLSVLGWAATNLNILINSLLLVIKVIIGLLLIRILWRFM